jgi:hypothetical protein
MERHNLYASPYIVRVIKSRRVRWMGHAACRGGMRDVYKIMVCKPEGKRPLGRHRLIWKDNIRMDLREIGWEDVIWIHLTRDRDH